MCFVTFLLDYQNCIHKTDYMVGIIEVNRSNEVTEIIYTDLLKCFVIVIGTTS